MSVTLLPGCATPVEAGIAADLLRVWAEQHAMAPEKSDLTTPYSFLDLEMCVVRKGECLRSPGFPCNEDLHPSDPHAPPTLV